MPTKITDRLKAGTVIERTDQDGPSLASRPFTWNQCVERFDGLVEGRIDAGG